MGERRIDIDGRDVTAFPGLWSDTDRLVHAVDEEAEETYRLLGLAALAFADRIRSLLELKTKTGPERNWRHVGYMQGFMQKLSAIAEDIENK
jgi:hypothetical protein